MTNRTANHIGFVGGIDGLIALTITVLIVRVSNHSLAALHQLSLLQIRFVDAAFGVSFVLAWQYCFSVLNLYDKFATIPSKMLATFKGASIMTVAVVIHLMISHPPDITIRIAFMGMASLFSFEIDPEAISDHLLDRLAPRAP